MVHVVHTHPGREIALSLSELGEFPHISQFLIWRDCRTSPMRMQRRRSEPQDRTLLRRLPRRRGGLKASGFRIILNSSGIYMCTQYCESNYNYYKLFFPTVPVMK